MKILRKLSDRGSTFVIVIVTIGFIGVLTSLVLMVTSVGYQTKAIDNQSKNNFYSSEEVIDQIKTGLHNDMSQAILASYFEALTNYRSLFIAGSAVENKEERLRTINKDFRERVIGNDSKGFIHSLKYLSPDADINDRVIDGGTSVGGALGVKEVNNDVLRSYISQEYMSNNDSGIKIKVGVPKNESSDGTITFDYDPSEFTYIIIKNIGINFTNELGYTNTLFTDIRMDIPSIDFSFLDLDIDDEFKNYALMAKGNVNYTSAAQLTSDSAIIGNYFVGTNFNVSNAARIQTAADYGYIGGVLNLTSGDNTVTSQSNRYMFEHNILRYENVSNRDNLWHYSDGSTYKSYPIRSTLPSLKQKKGSTVYETDSAGNSKVNMATTYLAVGDINIDGTSRGVTTNMLNTDTNLLVKNDLVFNLDYAKANIYKRYRGYGYALDSDTFAEDGDKAAASASIILNNKNCVLNMELDDLSLLGSAFIKTNNLSNPTPIVAKDVLTGDSLIVRGNQIAYLVPAKYVEEFNTNPVTLAEATAKGKTPIDIAEDIKNYLNANMRAFVEEYLDPDNPVRPIYYSYNDTTDYVAYYYFNFINATKASQYYHHAEHDDTEMVSETTKRTLLGLIPAEINVNIKNTANVISNYITDLKADDSGVIGDYVMNESTSSDTTDGKTFSDIAKNLNRFLQKEEPKGLKQARDDAEADPTVPAETRDKIMKYFDRDAIENILDWTIIHGETQDIILNTTYSDPQNSEKANIIITRHNIEITSSNIVLKNSSGGTVATISKADTTSSAHNGLFVTTGNITINANVHVKGLLVAGFSVNGAGNRVLGNITLGRHCTLEANEQCISNIFRDSAKFRTADGEHFNKVFRGFDYDDTAGVHVELSEENGTIISLNKMFTYQNWSKQ